MSHISLLDCTLRDGGYVNDWKFGQTNLVSVVDRLQQAGVDIIEIGFLDDRRPFDMNRSIMPDTASAKKIWKDLHKGNAMIVGMIDYGTCAIENLEDASDSVLDGIRVIFKKHLMHEAMAFCAEVKRKGYRVFAQLVSVTSYSDDELGELISLVNDVKPYAVSMVDTYGLLFPDRMLHIYEILDREVAPEVTIGFHAHNNFQLAYANGLAFLRREHRHDIVVDGTLYGMGKSAGNAPLELLAMTLNDEYGKSYRIDPMLEAIEETVYDFYSVSPWGYKTFFYLCAKNRCHPNYLTFFEQKKNLSVSKIDELLSRIEPEEKKLLYDRNVAEALYQEAMAERNDDFLARIAFLKETEGKRILLVGPGSNIRFQEKKVADFIAAADTYVISVNYIPENIRPDCVFVTNSTRYHDMTLPLQEERNSGLRILATTNVESRGRAFDFVVNRAPLLEASERIMDNSFLMLIRFLKNTGIDSIFCAGFDGYSDRDDNYCNPVMEYSFIKREASYLNRHMKAAIAAFRETMKIEFITYSAYDAEEDINGASI